MDAERLKILQVIPTLDRSGAEKQLALLAAGLDPERFEVHVCALTRGGPYERELVRAGIPVTVLGRAMKFDPRPYGRLVRLIRRHRYDIVHTWLFAGNSLGRVCARRARVPLVVASERCVDVWKARWQLAVDRRLAAWTDAIVANSTGVRDFYVEQGIDPGLVEVIHNGIDTGPPAPVEVPRVRAELGIPPDAFVVGSIGRLWHQKRMRHVAFALGILREAMDGCYGLIVGEGPRRSAMEHFLASTELDDRVRLLGHRADVPRLLQAMDVVVSASVFEGLPNVVLEAMRCARPVVATNIPGTRDVVVGGETGLLVRPDSAVALARGVFHLYEHPDEARRMGLAGRERVTQHFTVKKMIDRYAALYQRLARTRRPGGDHSV